MLDLGLKSVHVGPCNIPYELDQQESLIRQFMDENQVFSDIPFNGRGFIRTAAAIAKQFPDRIKLIANVRSKDSWVKSMLRDSQNHGGDFFRKSYDIPLLPYEWTAEDLEKVYDSHHELLETLGIPTVQIGVWKPLCQALGVFNHSVEDACWTKSRQGEGPNKGLIPKNVGDMRDDRSGPCHDRDIEEDGSGSGFRKMGGVDALMRAVEAHSPCGMADDTQSAKA
jgi:hypothetical protein